MKLIPYLLEFLFPSRTSERMVREATMESVGSYADPLQHDADTISLLPYRAPLVRSLIVEAKFRDNEKAQQLLGMILADYIRSWLEEHAALGASPVTLVAVPLSAARQKERGYNQSERILHAALSTIPEARNGSGMLVRIRDTAPQTSLGGYARRNNLIDAFASQDANPLHTYIVVDDVLTTGSTLESALRALRKAGASRILGLSLAH